MTAAHALSPTQPGFALYDAMIDSGPETVSEHVAKELADRYEILEPIGQGGMGVVYRARQTSPDREVAIKLLRPEYAKRPLVLERMRREALSGAKTVSPHVVTVTEFGCLSDGSAFLAMELLRGRELAHELDRHGAFGWERASAIASQICEALAEVHALGIVHRDLKPENVFLVEHDGTPDFVKILDFGLAKMRGVATITLAGVAIGTPHYMSPEQCLGETTDHRADIYSLGVMLYEMLAGHVPFYELSFPGILAAQVGRAPDSIKRHAPGLSDARADVVMRCLAKRPEDRFQSARELADALRCADEEHYRSPPSRSSTHAVVRQRDLPTYMPLSRSFRRSKVFAWMTLALGHFMAFAIGFGVLHGSASEATVRFYLDPIER